MAVVVVEVVEGDKVDTMEADLEDKLGGRMVGKVDEVVIAEVLLARAEMKAVGSSDSLGKEMQLDTKDTLWAVGQKVASELEVLVQLV